MNKRGHTAGAVIASAAAVYYTKQNIPFEMLMVSGIVLGSFLPDLDADHSTFNSMFPTIKRIYDILPKCNVTKHRGALLHSILTLIPFFIFKDNPIMYGIGIGILGHHLLDMMTPAGLRYFYPFNTIVNIWNY